MSIELNPSTIIACAGMMAVLFIIARKEKTHKYLWIIIFNILSGEALLILFEMTGEDFIFYLPLNKLNIFLSGFFGIPGVLSALMLRSLIID